ncbi:MAG: hypothetical protein U5L09_19145 [Bacteroidales bacterium]|nr:hypothetical protein [Bacteroidales bacterium]
MNFSFYIAKRYLASKKSHNIINVITGVSVAGVTIGAMALIVVLSVFNGFEQVVSSFSILLIQTLKLLFPKGRPFLLKTSTAARWHQKRRAALCGGGGRECTAAQ